MRDLTDAQSLCASSSIFSNCSLVLGSRFPNSFVCITKAAGIVISFSGVVGSHKNANQATAAEVNQLGPQIGISADPTQAQPLITRKGIA